MTRDTELCYKTRMETALKDYREALEKQNFSGDTSTLVMGEGPAPALLMLIGEAPGAQEVLAGKPFVGKAGKQLDDFLQSTGLDRQSLYVGNAVKYRPTNPKGSANRTPSKKEIDLGRPLLLAEIAFVQPQVIVSLGNSPLYAITQDKNLRIGDVHGESISWEGRVLFPLYHPASVIYNRGLVETYKEDVKRVKQYVDSLKEDCAREGQ